MNNNFSQKLKNNNLNQIASSSSNATFKSEYATPTIHDYYDLYLNEKRCQTTAPGQVDWYINLVGKLRQNGSNEEEQRLLNQISKGGKIAEIAQKKLFNIHLGTVILIAKKLCSKIRKSKLEDVIQDGNIGLLNAIQIYNPKKDGDFTHFAINHIIRSIAEKNNLYHLL